MEELREDGPKLDEFVSTLSGWKAKTSFEKKLVLGILHRKGHKNFEEMEDEAIDVKYE